MSRVRHLCLTVALLLTTIAPADTLTFVSSDVPVHIPDGPGGNPGRSYLTVPVAREILDVNITFSITHTWVGDLNIYLEAPGGVEHTVQLVFRCGGSQNNGDNFTNTTLDDEAATYVCAANPPYTGTFQPYDPLYALDGLSAQGQWEFRVTDNAAQDTGSIQAWQITIIGNPLTAGDPPAPYPSSLALSAYPNPFNAVTMITFVTPKSGIVRLDALDVLGRGVMTLTNQYYPAGAHSVTFDGADLPSGAYIAHLLAGDMSQARKLVLIK